MSLMKTLRPRLPRGVSLLPIFSALTVLSLFLSGGQSVRAQENEPDLSGFTWQIQRLEAPALFYNLTDRTLRFDSNNNAHIVYGGDHLYYARFAGNNKTLVTVDGGYGVGSYASLALDSNNRPHISYYDAAHGALKYAYSDGANWHVQTVDTPTTINGEPEAAPDAMEGQTEPHPSILDQLSPAAQPRDWTSAPPSTEGAQPLFVPAKQGVGWYTSIAIDSDDWPHISYYDAINDDLKYASFNGLTWEIDTVLDSDASPTLKHQASLFTSLALDAGDNPHISYYNDRRNSLYYASYIGGWDFEQVDDTLFSGTFTSLALGKSGRAYISYYDNVNENLMFAKRINGVWSTETVDSAGDVGQYTSLALDDNLVPRISYYDATNGNLKYARTSDGAWVKASLYETGDTGAYTSIALNNKDNPGIVFYNVSTGELNFTRWDGSNWILNNVDVSRDLGLYTSIALNPNDHNTSITYVNDSSGMLKYGYKANLSWVPYVLAERPNYRPTYNDLAFDKSGIPYVGFYDSKNGDLKYTYWAGTGWAKPLDIDTTDDVGLYPSLAFDKSNILHISYYDASHARLRYARYTGGRWVTLTVDDSASVGEYTSLALSSTGTPYISYYDRTNGDLKIAFLDPATLKWIISTVDSGGAADVGRFTSLAMSSTDQPSIAYYDVTNADLKYAVFNPGSGWAIQTIDSAREVGQYASLALNAGNAPVISYYDATNGDLKYAAWSNNGWMIQTLDSNGDVGMYTSLLINAAGWPEISYYDRTNGDLKYATGFTIKAAVFLPVVRR